MFKLLKLAVYGLAGYAAYQIYLGITEGSARSTGGKQRGVEYEGGRMGTAGRSATERTEEPTGQSGSHKVGRGVI